MDWINTQRRLAEDRGHWKQIAKATGLSGNHVLRIAHGETKNPRLDTMQKIIAYYSERDKVVA